MTDNILSTLTPKQKITGIVLVAVIGIIVWQAMGLFGGGGSNATPAPAAPPTQQVGQTPNGQPPNANTPPGPSPQQQIARQLPISSTFLPTENRAIIEKQQKNLGMYIEKVNKLQSLKVEKEIAEVSQAIAAANLSAAKSDKDLSTLLTAPAQPTAADYAGKLSQNQTGFSTMLPSDKTEAAAEEQGGASPPLQHVEYVVVSISMQLDKWTAVLGYQGKLYAVHVGDTLPADKSVVTKITSDSVTLTKNKKDTKINMMNTI